mmetsp:Transcript_37348/g.73483  ORF Transcript_37348/g.73483 Transcript_37348/m.73483 type:complete len:108 (-) Transcript_37348:102-425(-)
MVECTGVVNSVSLERQEGVSMEGNADGAGSVGAAGCVRMEGGEQSARSVEGQVFASMEEKSICAKSAKHSARVSTEFLKVLATCAQTRLSWKNRKKCWRRRKSESTQ